MAKGGGRVYAISLDMDIESLKIHYGDPYNNAYVEIRKVSEAGLRLAAGHRVLRWEEHQGRDLRPGRDRVGTCAPPVRRVGPRHPDAED